MTNIWHDMNPDRIKPTDFIAVVKFQKVVRRNMS